MNISSRVEFAADPDRVYAMLIDKDYQEEVCRASEAQEFEVTVDGASTHSSRKLPAPDSAKRFVGSTLTVVEDVSWDVPTEDGHRSAEMSLSVPGQPVTMRGNYQLFPDGEGSVLTLTGELKVNIPLLGKKLEESAAPAVLAGFRTQQKVGNDWLAKG